MTKNRIIEKYIERIMVDYPEADKIHIDLVQFAEELRQCDVVSNMDIEIAAVNAYKGKDLNEQRANIDKILAFENGAKWALSKLSNNGS